MKKKILQYGNQILEQRSEEVKEFNTLELKTLVADMLDTLNARGNTAAGLSAPQIGILKRLAICRRMDLEEVNSDADPIWEVMINPVIKVTSKETTTMWEGCLSINQGDLFGKVTRPKDVKVEYYDIEGKKKSLNASGYFSHVIQHEIDHLDGKLFISYIPNPAELYTSEEMD
jgi:peptide deformylase